jgi:hypothetical protein
MFPSFNRKLSLISDEVCSCLSPYRLLRVVILSGNPISDNEGCMRGQFFLIFRHPHPESCRSYRAPHPARVIFRVCARRSSVLSSRTIRLVF